MAQLLVPDYSDPAVPRVDRVSSSDLLASLSEMADVFYSLAPDGLPPEQRWEWQETPMFQSEGRDVCETVYDVVRATQTGSPKTFIGGTDVMSFRLVELENDVLVKFQEAFNALDQLFKERQDDVIDVLAERADESSRNRSLQDRAEEVMTDLSGVANLIIHASLDYGDDDRVKNARAELARAVGRAPERDCWLSSAEAEAHKKTLIASYRDYAPDGEFSYVVAMGDEAYATSEKESVATQAVAYRDGMGIE